MKLKKLYELCIKEGMKTDLRHSRQLANYFLGVRKEYRQCTSRQKQFFDIERLSNPYADSRILHGDPDLEIKTVMIGIDIEVGELLLAKQLGQWGKKIDLVIAHHPQGIALARLDDVMHLQSDILINLGVGPDVAKKLTGKRIADVSRRLHSANHGRIVDAARLLDIPLMCCHTPADNHVAAYLQRTVDKKKPASLAQVIEVLLKEPEYKEAARKQAGPQVLIGNAKSKAGKIFVDMTGGTEGSEEVFARLSQLGINTLLGMHYSEAHYKRIKQEYINVVNAGHIASDNLGMNLLLDKIEKAGKLNIVECSGFKRFKRLCP